MNDRLNEEYKVGVAEYLNYAFSKMGEQREIRCPCVKFKNTDKGSREVVEMHLNVYGMMPNYTFWYHHGERRGETQSNDDDDDEVEENETEEEIQEILQDFYPDYYGLDKSGMEVDTSSQIGTEFHLPLKAVGHYVVAKYSPMSEDGKAEKKIMSS
ncbi:hypothetical protein ACS0TY_018844 [Phlomoides rotata]